MHVIEIYFTTWHSVCLVSMTESKGMSRGMTLTQVVDRLPNKTPGTYNLGDGRFLQL